MSKVSAWRGGRAGSTTSAIQGFSGPAQGMAGGLYGVATALGMFALATFAGRLWKLGVPVWELFGQAFGQRIQRAGYE